MMIKILDVVIGGILMGGIYALIAVGFSLQYGVARVLNVSHGEFIMLGAFLTWWLFNTFNVNPLVSLFICGPALFAIGFLLHKTIYRSIRMSAGSPEVFENNSMMASFGFLFIIQNVAILIWGAKMRGYSYLAVPVSLGGAEFAANRLVMLSFAVLICLLFYLFLTRTRLGKAIRAAAQDPAAAGLMGVNINQVLALCFGLGTLMAGLAGSLLSMSYMIHPTMGFEYTIIAI
ncbi:MAG: branched-chain amino acid ABC transporter permease, partial [Firmicutes bacterium]|nr:branched-chain amino acid ABC transporter permease [Bacillota bacterium]